MLDKLTSSMEGPFHSLLKNTEVADTISLQIAYVETTDLQSQLTNVLQL